MSTQNLYELTVDGMRCAHCVQAVTQSLLELDPNAHIDIDLSSGKVKVQSATPLPNVTAAITDAGYQLRAPAR